jgi:hypothetical protein
MTENFVEQIEDLTRTSFKVTKIPVATLKQFKLFCKEECGDIYWVGIYQLLKMKAKYEDFLTLFNSLKKEIDELKIQLNKKSGGEIKTFQTK